VDAPEVEVEMLRFDGPLGDASRSETKDERDEEEKSEDSRFFPFDLLKSAPCTCVIYIQSKTG
jgi:hypothetical protein